MKKEPWIVRTERSKIHIDAMMHAQEIFDQYKEGEYEVLSIAVASIENGEAYLFPIRKPVGCVCYADFALDINCWAQEYYDKSVLEMRREIKRIQKAAKARREQEAKQNDN
jgi:hypothetical protein